MNMQRLFAGAASCLLLAACSSVAPDKPARAQMYDFGPLATAVAAAAAPSQPALVLAELDAVSPLETPALLYRLGYADAHQLHPYAQARWSAPPARLVQQRLRERLARDRPVLDLAESASLARTGGASPRVLRVELEEFSHIFDAPAQSFGIVRMRATLMENSAAGERLVAQRTFVQRQPAPTADAPGGVRALTAATDAIAQDIAAWVAAQR